MSGLTHFLGRLGEVNRASMHRANDQAKRLGWAGAWAAVMLGFCGFLISLYAMRRLGRKFLSPLEEIHSVLHAYGQGDRFRRCTLHHSSPEFREAGETINQLLDRAWSPDESSFQTGSRFDRGHVAGAEGDRW